MKLLKFTCSTEDFFLLFIIGNDQSRISFFIQDKEKMSNMVRHIIKERFNSPDKRPGDFLDQALNDMASEKFLTEDFIAELSFGILFAAFESVSTTLTLAIKFLAENPLVLEELTVRA